MSYRSASSRAAAFDDALREAMGAPVRDRFDVEPPHTPAEAARAYASKRHSPYRVAPMPAVLDHDSDAADRDGVEHTRKARLRRWQETRG